MPRRDQTACKGVIVAASGSELFVPDGPGGASTPSSGEIVSTLGRMGLLELNSPGPWPELSEEDDIYPISWREVEAERGRGLLEAERGRCVNAVPSRVNVPLGPNEAPLSQHLTWRAAETRRKAPVYVMMGLVPSLTARSHQQVRLAPGSRISEGYVGADD
jgi:hypothetical protein